MTSRGSYSHFLQHPCELQHPYSEVRTWNQHPVHTMFNTPHRKPYVIENRTPEPKTISIGLKAWEREEGEKYLTIPPFDDQTVFVNTTKQHHHFLKIHNCNTKQILSAKFLNPVYSLATIVGHHDCKHCIQLQITPGW